MEEDGGLLLSQRTAGPRSHSGECTVASFMSGCILDGLARLQQIRSFSIPSERKSFYESLRNAFAVGQRAGVRTSQVSN